MGVQQIATNGIEQGDRSPSEVSSVGLQVQDVKRRRKLSWLSTDSEVGLGNKSRSKPLLKGRGIWDSGPWV